MTGIMTIISLKNAKVLSLPTALVIAFLVPTFFANKATAESQLNDWASFLDEQYAEPVDGAFTLLVSILCGDKQKEDEYRENIKRETQRGCERGVYHWLLARTQISKRQFTEAIGSYTEAINELSAIDENLIRAIIIKQRGLALIAMEPESVDQALEEMLAAFPDFQFREPLFPELNVRNEVAVIYTMKVSQLAGKGEYEAAIMLADDLLDSLEKEDVDLSVRIGIATNLSQTYMWLQRYRGLSKETITALSDAEKRYADYAVELIAENSVSPTAAEALVRAMRVYRPFDSARSENYGKRAGSMFREMGYPKYAETVDRWAINEPYKLQPLKQNQDDSRSDNLKEN